MNATGSHGLRHQLGTLTDLIALMASKWTHQVLAQKALKQQTAVSRGSWGTEL